MSPRSVLFVCHARYLTFLDDLGSHVWDACSPCLSIQTPQFVFIPSLPPTGPVTSMAEVDHFLISLIPLRHCSACTATDTDFTQGCLSAQTLCAIWDFDETHTRLQAPQRGKSRGGRGGDKKSTLKTRNRAQNRLCTRPLFRQAHFRVFVDLLKDISDSTYSIYRYIYIAALLNDSEFLCQPSYPLELQIGSSTAHHLGTYILHLQIISSRLAEPFPLPNRLSRTSSAASLKDAGFYISEDVYSKVLLIVSTHFAPHTQRSLFRDTKNDVRDHVCAESKTCERTSCPTWEQRILMPTKCAPSLGS